MVSGWKVRRELERLWQQTKGIGNQLTDPVAQRRLDSLVEDGLPLLQGAMPRADKIALLLIFQPSGIQQSTLRTCRWLAQAGYAPLVVSNAPIAEDDRAPLAEVVWRAVERPNFGYDFGGYRDGLTCLAQWGVAPEELLILNDSIWLPVLPEPDILARLALEPAEIAGTILRERGEERFLESYLYRLRRPALEHPAFSTFWKDLQLTSNKYHVIRRGERGFSAAMRAAGLRVAGVYDTSALVERIADQDTDFLERTLHYGAYIDPQLAAERDRLLSWRRPGWQAAALDHVNRVLKKRMAYSSFPYAMVHLTGYPLLKKSSEPISRAWRIAHMKATEAGDLPPPPPPLLTEIRARDSGG